MPDLDHCRIGYGYIPKRGPKMPKPGFYWFRYKGGNSAPTICEVFVKPDGLGVLVMGEDMQDDESFFEQYELPGPIIQTGGFYRKAVAQ